MKDAEKLSEKSQKAFPCETFFALEDDILFYLDNLNRFDSKGEWIRDDKKSEEWAEICETVGDFEPPKAERWSTGIWRRIINFDRVQRKNFEVL